MNPNANKPYKARVLVQPFGSRRSPANWGRVVTFLQFAACELLRVTTGAFVDEVCSVESHRIAMSSFWAFKQLLRNRRIPNIGKEGPAAFDENGSPGRGSVCTRHTRSCRNQDREERQAQGAHFPCPTIELSDPSSSEQVTGKVRLLFLTFSGKTWPRDDGATDFDAVKTAGNLPETRSNTMPCLVVPSTRGPSAAYFPLRPT